VKLKHKLAAGILSLSLVSGSVYASGWPTVDLAALSQQLIEQLETLERFQQSVKQWTNQLNAQIQGQGKAVDAMNNGFANQIVRNNQALDDQFNRQLKMEMQPSFDACGTYSVTNALNDAICSLLENVSQSGEDRVANLMNDSSDGKRISAVSRSQKNAKSVIDLATSLNHDGSGSNKNISNSVIRADLMLGSQGDTYDQDTMQATKAFNDIVVGSDVATAPSNKNEDDLLGYVDNYLRPNAMRAIAANSLASIRELRVGEGDDPDKLSVMQAMQQFVDDHFGTPEGDKWIKMVTNTQENADDFMSDSSVLRSIAQMDAFNNYLAMMKYQSQLRQETISAAILTLHNKETYGN
jgi:hypothetical protein